MKELYLLWQQASLYPKVMISLLFFAPLIIAGIGIIGMKLEERMNEMVKLKVGNIVRVKETASKSKLSNYGIITVMSNEMKKNAREIKAIEGNDVLLNCMGYDWWVPSQLCELVSKGDTENK